MTGFMRPEVYGPGWTTMHFDRRQLVPLLDELVGRRPISAEYKEAFDWLNANIPIFVNTVNEDGGMGPQCRRYEVALRRAATGVELCFYDRQILEQVAEGLHHMFGETLEEGVHGV